MYCTGSANNQKINKDAQALWNEINTKLTDQNFISIGNVKQYLETINENSNDYLHKLFKEHKGGKSVKEIADECDISLPTLNRYQKNLSSQLSRSINPDTIFRLADSLGLSENEIQRLCYLANVDRTIHIFINQYHLPKCTHKTIRMFLIKNNYCI